MNGGRSTGRRIGEHGIAGLAGHREAMIEAAAAGAGRRDHQPVERGTAALVGVEPVANELAKEAAALRIAVADHPLQRRRHLAQRRALRPVFQIRREVTDGGQAKTSDRRALRPVDGLVDPGADA